MGANTLPPMFFDAAGKDPAGLNAYNGGTGNEGGDELGGGEEEGDAEDPFSIELVCSSRLEHWVHYTENCSKILHIKISDY